MFQRFFGRINIVNIIKFTRAYLLSAILLGTMATNTSAQLSIQLGGNEADFKARLTAEGYDRIDTVKIGMSNSSFDACKAGKRYRIRFEWTGHVSQKVIGKCRIMVDEKSIRKLLRERGYKRISIEDRAGKYLALGCFNSDRYRIEVNYMGDIGRERRIGRCQKELSPSDITAKLENDGYDRIRFTDRQLPTYIAQVCNKNDKLELYLNRYGDVKKTRKIGECLSEILPGQVVQLLKDKGFKRVKLIDDRLPRYIAQACRNDQRLEISVNRWGDISDQVRIGRCRNDYSAEQIINSMRDNNYTNISVRKSGGNFIAKGCRDNRYSQIILTPYGELIERKELGSCNAPRINDLAESFRKRGLSNIRFFVEACRDGRKIQIEFDEFANRIGRQTIGSCN